MNEVIYRDEANLTRDTSLYDSFNLFDTIVNLLITNKEEFVIWFS